MLNIYILFKYLNINREREKEKKRKRERETVSVNSIRYRFSKMWGSIPSFVLIIDCCFSFNIFSS